MAIQETSLLKLTCDIVLQIRIESFPSSEPLRKEGNACLTANSEILQIPEVPFGVTIHRRMVY